MSPAPPASTMQEEPVASTSQSGDLTLKILPNLDRHLALPLLDFLDGHSEDTTNGTTNGDDEDVPHYDHADILKAKIDLLRPTKMVTYSENLEKELGQTTMSEEEYRQREAAVLKELEEYEKEASGVMDIISNPQVFQSLKQDKMQNLIFLKEQHNLTVDQIGILYKFGRFLYSVGRYDSAGDYLYHFRVLTPDSELLTSALWGKLVSNILEGNFDAALEETKLLKDNIDEHFRWESRNSLQGLQQRTWLLHWSLFVFFNHEQGREELLDTWLAQTAIQLPSSGQSHYIQFYLPTIQTNAPWLIRYLAAAAILANPKKIAFKSNSQSHLGPNSRIQTREHLGEVVIAVLSQETYQYKDPITEFLRLLFVDLDFEGAAEQLARSTKIIKSDFFLVDFLDEFQQRARQLFSEAYCRVHHRIDIADLSSRLGLSSDEGEKWIVTLIRDARLDAKIDFKEGAVYMNKQYTTASQAVIDKTKSFLDRSARLAQAIDPSAGSDGQQPSFRGGRGGRGGSVGRGGASGRGRGAPRDASAVSQSVEA
ncbi:uncharacterized protein L969DRAFT_46793 [Mixia osmundae IAM 14324]|uniref:Eukaryotic translation initiation factor 3 subunit E n=1 Tax=Mixia osmundae (strain CBS 9802 / IAM 14324 / JCM 22182 / KY 12970) TaxID=764103 RepID=G7E5A2_MIXOS|nr:uncharacterized protein L969DRAFT_46793 [Mixia osmundae IAM 14324]KEI40839.1 hypothetical protein L969DRAFT_46793 [Mixia osmundae IAM 14324]GAA98012.1 hypothetical protein E5Q_04692 [Mixia osmundae IAM 14324]